MVKLMRLRRWSAIQLTAFRGWLSFGRLAGAMTLVLAFIGVQLQFEQLKADQRTEIQQLMIEEKRLETQRGGMLSALAIEIKNNLMQANVVISAADKGNIVTLPPMYTTDAYTDDIANSQQAVDNCGLSPSLDCSPWTERLSHFKRAQTEALLANSRVAAKYLSTGLQNLEYSY